MKTRAYVSPEKLRGGFYTPPALVRHVLERLGQLLQDRHAVRVLEPSVGDGRFIHGLAQADLAVNELVGVELLRDEAGKALRVLNSSGLHGTIVNASTLHWSLSQAAAYDAVVGNLPFLRFQFVADADRIDAEVHARQLGVSVAGVSNLWLPMMLASLRLLRIGGAFALVLPTECLTGVSAGSARRWLADNCRALRCDLYPPGSFPGALQEVLIISGRRADRGAGDRALTVAQHSRLHSSESFDDSLATVVTRQLDVPEAGWTHHLLNSAATAALEEFKQLPAVRPLGEVARFEVATVTGANAFFCMPRERVDRYGLGGWVRPLLARIRHAPGLAFTDPDYIAAETAGVPTYIFDAALVDVDRAEHDGLDAYLSDGERLRLNARYKCRIRDPWWQVPTMRSGALLLSKRSHRYHRMVVNEVGAITTDTIYRGTMKSGDISPLALAAAFHNSGTLLTAELEGRYFGGGVLELVPSEVARVSVPVTQQLISEAPRLDHLSRTAAAGAARDLETLVTETDLLLVKADVGVTDEMVEALALARQSLLRRRLDRGTTDRSENASGE